MINPCVNDQLTLFSNHQQSADDEPTISEPKRNGETDFGVLPSLLLASACSGLKKDLPIPRTGDRRS